MSEYDFLVLGAGGTGLAAAMYAARLGLKTLVLGASHGSELPIGGVITTTDIVENYPGFAKISGMELTKKIEEQARSYKLVTIKEEKALNVKKSGNQFYVKTEKGTYNAKTILFATGTKWRKLDIPGSKEFERKGVNYCALCDGPLFRNKVIAVVGGSDSAVKEALVLSRYAKKVFLIARHDIHPETINLERLKHDKKIEVLKNTNIKEIRGDEVVKSILLDKPYKGKKEMKIEGIFVAIGHIPLSDLAKPMGIKLNESGEIKINDETTETNIKGIFAAGDVTDKKFKQLITGVSDGCTAAYYAYEYITKNKIVPN
jgi:thioredoxin reductase (NADPH)